MGAPRRSPIWKMPTVEFRHLVANSKTLTEMLRPFGLRNIGHNSLTLKKRLAEEGIDYSHIQLGRGSWYAGAGRGTGYRPKAKTLEECMSTVFIQNASGDKKTVRKYLRRYKLIEEVCRDCPLTNEWNGKPLTLQLEHVDGNSTNDRLENLCWLCPNCHSQTDTYTGKANRKKPVCAA